MASISSRISSDLVINAVKFDPANVTAETDKVKSILEDITVKTPNWEVIGAAEFRRIQEAGETALPPPTLLPRASDIMIPSRDAGRDIPVRVYKPDNGEPSKGVILYIHGGGFVLGSHKSSDPQLRMFANACQLTALSVGYRHAPENPFPAPSNDCIDVAEHLVDDGEDMFGAKLLFIMGQSSGGNLTAITTFALMRSRPKHQLAGLIMYYALFDASLSLPQSTTFTRPLLINHDSALAFMNAYLPGMNLDERRSPKISPVYEDMYSLAANSTTKKLPAALFHCGTDDTLTDDSILMSAKWQMTGSEGILKIYPGSPHGFDLLGGQAAEDSNTASFDFIREKLGGL